MYVYKCVHIAADTGLCEWGPSHPASPYSLPEVAGVARPDVGEKMKEVANREEKHGRAIACAQCWAEN